MPGKGRAILWTAGVVAVLGVVVPAAIAAVALTSRPLASDLAVVPGNAVTPAGSPSSRLQARLDTAVALYRAGFVPRILVSGGIEPSGADEAAVMARYLLGRGVPDAAILRDPHGDDTFATARHTAALVRRDARVLVVTQWFHVPRTMLALRRFGIRRVSAAWPRFAEWRDAYSLLREAAALPYYALRPVDAPGGAAPRRPRS